MARQPDGLSTVRQRRAITARRAAWVDVTTGAGVVDDGVTFTARTGTAGELLDGVPEVVRLVHLVGPRPGGDADGFATWRTSCGAWSEGQHFTESLSFPVLRYEHDGRRIDVQRAAGWLGEGDYTPGQARDAMTLAARVVAAHFGGLEFWSTAATTGRELWRSTIPRERAWPVLSDEDQHLIRSTTGQGRVELRDVGDTLPGLAEMDGRLMYGALCWGLTSGRPTHGHGEAPGWKPQTRGRFRCAWTVPEWWEHVGLLGAMAPRGGWHYPSAPGERAEAWVDGAELALARAQGWTVDVLEHLVFDTAGGGDPLRVWADKLVAAWQAAELADAEPEVRRLARAAVRSILLHGIGAFAGRERTVSCSAPIDRAELIPAGAVMPRIEGERWVWGEKRAAAAPELAHPEWSAAVWARCRVRLLDSPTGDRGTRAGALHIPAASVVAMRTDALYLTERPAWPDDGKVGRLRLKAWQGGPLEAPRNLAGFLALRAGGRAV